MSHHEFSARQRSGLASYGSSRLDRRLDAARAVIVDTGFELNFNKGFRIAGEYLRAQGVPPNVVMRVINYATRRAVVECLPTVVTSPPRSVSRHPVAESHHERLLAGQI
jgi:hypothetical protein